MASYKTCAVPMCKNTTTKLPDKLFIHVPKCPKRRKQWLQLARRDPELTSNKSAIYFCEDHFDLPNDMENYIQYSVMGSVSKIRMKPDCLPSKFQCQLDRIKRTALPQPRSAASKRKRKQKMKLPKDMENYMQYHVQGSVSQIRMVPGTLPSKFPQTDEVKAEKTIDSDSDNCLLSPTMPRHRSFSNQKERLKRRQAYLRKILNNKRINNENSTQKKVVNLKSSVGGSAADRSLLRPKSYYSVPDFQSTDWARPAAPAPKSLADTAKRVPPLNCSNAAGSMAPVCIGNAVEDMVAPVDTAAGSVASLDRVDTAASSTPVSHGNAAGSTAPMCTIHTYDLDDIEAGHSSSTESATSEVCQREPSTSNVYQTIIKQEYTSMDKKLEPTTSHTEPKTKKATGIRRSKRKPIKKKSAFTPESKKCIIKSKIQNKEVQKDKSTQTRLTYSESNAIITNVYNYLKHEFVYLENLLTEQVRSEIDLSFLSNILARTAAATGVSEQTVSTILCENKFREHARAANALVEMDHCYIVDRNSLPKLTMVTPVVAKVIDDKDEYSCYADMERLQFEETEIDESEDMAEEIVLLCEVAEEHNIKESGEDDSENMTAEIVLLCEEDINESDKDESEDMTEELPLEEEIVLKCEVEEEHIIKYNEQSETTEESASKRRRISTEHGHDEQNLSSPAAHQVTSAAALSEVKTEPADVDAGDEYQHSLRDTLATQSSSNIPHDTILNELKTEPADQDKKRRLTNSSEAGEATEIVFHH